MAKHIGFTGTRDGMTEEQKISLHVIFGDLRSRHEVVVLHHGDCVGADEEAANIAGSLGFVLVSHPPVSPRLRANTAATVVRPAKGYLERNRDIVDDSEHLYACPKGPEELRSGTWATIRYAVRNRKPVTVVTADGTAMQIDLK